jgi:predicted nucleic acid-binding protein
VSKIRAALAGSRAFSGRLERTGKLDSRRAEQAVEDFAVMPCTRWTTYPLLREVWALRANMTSYDAAYVALARRLACPLVTTDVRSSRVPDLRITVLVP